MSLYFLGALVFAAAPLFFQANPAGPGQGPAELSGLQLQESSKEVRRLMGEPLLVADINSEFRAWQYRVGDLDHDDFSHSLVFRKATDTLVSMSRTFEKPIQVERLLPPSHSTYYRYPETGPTEMVVRVHGLSGDRYLLAFGSAKPGDPASQIVLIHRSAMRAFYPWLADRLK